MVSCSRDIGIISGSWRELFDKALQARLDASDIVQETFLKAHREFDRFTGATEPELVAWMRQILVRNIADLAKHHRRKARDLRRQESLEAMLERSSVELQDALAAPLNSPSDHACQRERSVILTDALERLPADYREVFVLRNLEHVKMEEIAVPHEPIRQRRAQALDASLVGARESLGGIAVSDERESFSAGKGGNSSESELGRVLDSYLLEIEEGRHVDPERLLREHPVLADRLRACLAVFQAAGDDDQLRENPVSLGLSNDLRRRIEEARRSNKQVEGAAKCTVSIPFKQIESACESFTADWKPGSPQVIESYLERVELDSQNTLLRNLLAIDLERRRQVGQHPHIEDYLKQFPRFASLVRSAFLESNSVSSLATGSELKPKVASMKAPVASRLGDYRLLGELGHGGMGVVYEAVHLQHGTQVALKTLPTLDGASLHLFKREFRRLSGVNHPNLIGLHMLEVDGCQWFFTMDLVEGGDFLSFVRPGGVLDEARLRSGLNQLVAGVMALHGHRIIHRDLKPSNVMVAHDGRVVLLDFGLVLELERANVSRNADGIGIAGTPAYMAPEQAAGLQVSAPGDWYAVGVMLYEALSGRRPFKGSMWEIIKAKQNHDAPPLSENESNPSDLAALCMRLLLASLEIAPTPSRLQKPPHLEFRSPPRARFSHPRTVWWVGIGNLRN